MLNLLICRLSTTELNVMKEEAEFEEEPISKSQIKRDADALVVLAKKIAALSADQFDRMPLSDDLRASLLNVRRLTKGGAIKRQFKYIAKQIRESGDEDLSQALDRQLDKDQAAAARLHMFEHWRDKLVTGGDEALADFIQHFPNTDRQYVRQQQRKAQQELTAQKPPAASRKLFQYIKELNKE